MWAENNAADSCHGGFADVQSLFHEERDKHEQAGKASDDKVGPMRLVDR